MDLEKINPKKPFELLFVPGQKEEYLNFMTNLRSLSISLFNPKLNLIKCLVEGKSLLFLKISNERG